MNAEGKSTFHPVKVLMIKEEEVKLFCNTLDLSPSHMWSDETGCFHI